MIGKKVNLVLIKENVIMTNQLNSALLHCLWCSIQSIYLNVENSSYSFHYFELKKHAGFPPAHENKKSCFK